jgi:hypothetical protein
MRTQRSRRYISGQLDKEGVKEARKKTQANRHKAPDSEEAWRFPFLLFPSLKAGGNPNKS